MSTLTGSIDRISDGIAVILLDDDEHQLRIPAELLPPEASEGQVYTITIERNQQEEERLAAEIADLRDSLKE
jgi:hypothetical protein